MENQKFNTNYFKKIEENLNQAHEIAQSAREKGFDPKSEVEIPIARNMAERVEGLISSVAPQIIGSGITERIQELEKKFGILDWRISLKIAEEIATGKFCKFDTEMEAIETGIRVGFAYLTLGTVSSPLEGLTRIKIRKTREGKEYFAVYYSGPIRSAGGTGAAISALIADYVRKKLGYSTYDPNEEEIRRMITEVYDYHERITNLQYVPSEKEIEFLVRNLPIQLDGDPSEKIEVSNYKDLERIETNRIRNGPCLVLGECLAQKAPKLWKQLSKWGSDFDLEHWNFLKEMISLQKKIKSRGKTKEEKKISPDYTYLADLVAGRPILTHPLRQGGFRLRYGRCRTTGMSSNAIHPATMKVLNDYIAIGTQLKTERPGKSTALSSCDSIEGPIILLDNGDVIRFEEDSKIKKSEIKEILYLGDMLVNYGDFLNRAHRLAPPGYCEEWWARELEEKIQDTKKLSQSFNIPEDILKNPTKITIPANTAITISKELKMPLHPSYTYHWNALSQEQFSLLLDYLKKGKIERTEKGISKIILPKNDPAKRFLEIIGLPHKSVVNEFILIEKEEARAIAATLELENTSKEKIKEIMRSNPNQTIVETINQFNPMKIRDKSGTFIGARMGRPEKAKTRKLKGSPQILFPVGEAGGRLRSLQSAMESGKIRAELPLYKCTSCDKDTIFPVCETCDKKTSKIFSCKFCGDMLTKKCPKPHPNHDGMNDTFKKRDIDINQYFNSILKKLKTRTYPDMIKGVRGTSNKDHIPEHLMKGFLRAKHKINVNKDGTTRYDMTQLGITHFKPKEIGTKIEKLRELGYKYDIHGQELKNEEQTLEIKPQDVILPSCQESSEEGADKILLRVAKFIDDLLVNLYNQKPFYNLESGKDLAGHLVLGLAPHTSAAIVGRIIGFSKTQGFYAHPLFHAAQRRDLDGDESSVILLLDALINFSREFLPAHRGATQDACLVITSKLVPAEVDDMVFDLDIAWQYPLEFYEAASNYKYPWEIRIDKISDRLNTKYPFSNFGFTHDVSNINKGARCSAYKTIPSMEEKLKGQMKLAEKIRAVDVKDVARLVIEKHFLKDTRGNLRRFSTQQFRCVNCNEKHRRPPLIGRCTKCNGKLIFTVSEGFVLKYLQPSISLAEKYEVSDYLRQNLQITRRMVEGIFGKEKEKQQELGNWF